MKFEQLLTNFDRGLCVKQLQNEAFVELAVLANTQTMIDLAEFNSLLSILSWNNEILMTDFMENTKVKQARLQHEDEILSYINERYRLIFDEPLKSHLAHLISLFESKRHLIDS
ncbi:hypothetical protein PALB_26600 [Pseudoalteromonas luteoviolacea B = ATCC 29581]|nr:hypothetical protein PALB_26600 [Pseudoalteromonas luteoviolacea B = ATCC 29581]